MPEATQVLLKRRPGTSVAEFRAYYQDHHAKLVLPWCKANGVTYYAQVNLLSMSFLIAVKSPLHPDYSYSVDPQPTQMDNKQSKPQHQPGRLGRSSRDGVPASIPPRRDG